MLQLNKRLSVDSEQVESATVTPPKKPIGKIKSQEIELVYLTLISFCT